MRTTVFRIASLFLLATTFIVADPPLATEPPAKEKSDSASINLRPVDGKLAQAVGRINENLRDLYTFVRKQPEKLDVGKAISQLRAQLAALV